MSNKERCFACLLSMFVMIEANYCQKNGIMLLFTGIEVKTIKDIDSFLY